MTNLKFAFVDGMICVDDSPGSYSVIGDVRKAFRPTPGTLGDHEKSRAWADDFDARQVQMIKQLIKQANRGVR